MDQRVAKKLEQWNPDGLNRLKSSHCKVRVEVLRTKFEMEHALKVP